MVGLKTDLAAERGLDFTLVATSSWEECATKLGLDEEFGIEDSWGRVEGSSGDGRINEIGSGDGMTTK